METPPSLNTLPTEIILNITKQKLPPYSLTALRQTSQKFYQDCGLKLIDESSPKVDRLTFLSMLARDNPRPGAAICGECVRWHPSTAFANEEELARSPYERQCITTSRVWVCPHRTYSLPEAEEIMRKAGPLEKRGFDICNDCEMKIMWSSMDHKPNLKSVSLVTQFRLLDAVCRTNDVLGTVREHFTTSRVSFILNHLHIPVCSHMRLSPIPLADEFQPEDLQVVKEDGKVLERFTQQYWHMPWKKGHGLGKCLWRCPFEDCHTLAACEAREVSRHNGERLIVLFLIIKRDLLDGLDKSRTQRWWADHSVTKSHLLTLTSDWRRWRSIMGDCNRAWRSAPVPPAMIREPSFWMVAKSWMKDVGRAFMALGSQPRI